MGLRLVLQPRPLCPAFVCSFCSSARDFACGFLQIPPRGGHPCRSANTSYYQACSGLSPPSYCPWRAYQKKRRVLLPAAVTLCVNQIVVYLLHSLISDIVHPLYPQHLILVFELFSNALAGHQLFFCYQIVINADNINSAGTPKNACCISYSG